MILRPGAVGISGVCLSMVLISGCGAPVFNSPGESRTLAAAECFSADENVKWRAMIAGLCGCPNGQASCDRTFSSQSAYAAAGQRGCADGERAELSFPGAWTHPTAGGAGNARNWGGGGTAAGGGHEGWDYIVADGTAVRAAGSGKVVFVTTTCGRHDSFCGNAWGNHVVVHHGGKTFTRYAHLAGGERVRVKVGDAVVPGQQVGEVGSTGASDSPHTHFELVYATEGWFGVHNPRNGKCVANPGLIPFKDVPTTGSPAGSPTPGAGPRAGAIGKVCKIVPRKSDGSPDRVANLRDANQRILAELTSEDKVKIRGWLDGVASVEVRVQASGKEFGAHVGAPAFVAESQIDLASCH